MQLALVVFFLPTNGTITPLALVQPALCGGGYVWWCLYVRLYVVGRYVVTITTTIEDDGGTKTATNGVLSNRILRTLLNRSEVKTWRCMEAPSFWTVNSKVTYPQHVPPHTMLYQYSVNIDKYSCTTIASVLFSVPLSTMQKG